MPPIIGRKAIKWLVLTLGLVPTLLFLSRNNSAGADFEGTPLTSATQLRKLSCHELELLYAQAPVGEIPCGYARGRLLLLTDQCFPRLKRVLAGSVWKGKHFEEDGSFVNQWLGFRALHSHAVIGPSWADNKPSIVMEYPPGTPVFGNMRDEIRQIGPGLYIGRFYDREPCPRFRGFFALELKNCNCN